MSHQDLLQSIDFDKYGKIEGVTTQKQALMMEKIIEGEPPYKAAIEAGFGVGRARTPWKLIDSTEFRRRFQEAAHNKGLTIERIAEKIGEHLDARANQTIEGKQVTQSDAPDYKVQQKALDQLAQFSGIVDAQKAAQAGSAITVSVTGPAAEWLVAALSER